MPREIVVGVDFGPGGEAAEALAARLVSAPGRLTLVHVVTDGALVPARDCSAFIAAERARTLALLNRERSLLRLAQSRSELRPGVQIDTRCVFTAAPGRGVCHVAGAVSADLVVVGASRMRGMARLLLGDDTAWVLQRAPCPVAVAPVRYGGPTARVSTHDNSDDDQRRPWMILICYDGSTDARAAIEHGGELLRGQPATVLTVWEPFSELVAHTSIGMVPLIPGDVDMAEMDNATRERADELAREGVDLAQSAGFKAQPRTCAQRTTAADAILDEAESIGATAILMGSRGRTGLKSLFLGSVSNGVLHRADRPVIVIPSPDVAEARRRK